jgi:WD40 repeat protein
LEGDMAAFATVNGTLGVWKLDGGEQASIIARELGRDPKLALIGSQRLLVTAAEEVCLWNIDRGQARRKLSGHPGVWHLVLLGSRELLTASEDWTITLWDFEAGTEIATLALDYEARKIAAGPDGLTLVVGDGGGDVYAFRLVR